MSNLFVFTGYRAQGFMFTFKREETPVRGDQREFSLIPKAFGMLELEAKVILFPTLSHL